PTQTASPCTGSGDGKLFSGTALNRRSSVKYFTTCLERGSRSRRPSLKGCINTLMWFTPSRMAVFQALSIMPLVIRKLPAYVSAATGIIVTSPADVLNVRGEQDAGMK